VSRFFAKVIWMKSLPCLPLFAAGLLLFVSSITASAAPSDQKAEKKPLERVRLQLKWRHQFQFAGYYAALHKGFYRDAGLDVQILEANEPSAPITAVLGAECEFGVFGTELLRFRAAGVPIVAVAAIFQHSPAIIAARTDRGILHVSDLAGKRLYMEPDAADLIVFLEMKGVQTNQFQNPFDRASHRFDVRQLIEGQVDAMYVYTTDELFPLTNANVPLVTFSPRQAGIDFYSDILFTTEQTIQRRPQMVQAFRKATIAGWDYAMDHPDEIIDLILTQYTKRHSREHLKAEAAQMGPLLETDIIEIGYMSQSRWKAIANTLDQAGMLQGPVDLDRFIYDRSEGQVSVFRYWREMLAAFIITSAALALSWKYYRMNRRLQNEVQQRLKTEQALRVEITEHKQSKKSVAALADLGIKLSAVNTAKEAAAIIMEEADRLFTWDACKLDLYSPKKNQIYQVLVKDTVNGQRVEFPPPYDHPHPSPLTKEIIEKGARLILRNPKEMLPNAVAFGDSSRPSASLMFVPIRQGGSVRGVATIQSYSPGVYNEENLQAFQALADHCGGALERLRVQGEREKLIEELQQALAQVKTLSGLLPICASCKKIRDDRGYWNQVEIYIRDRSGANFTHSICPDCSKKLYPQLFPKKDQTGQT
jgi:ABC-type nitrate/sulfonate/bicarbonate transport system substrate-binding protein